MSEPAGKKKLKRESSPDSFSEDEPPPSFSLATLGLQRVGAAPPPKPQPQLPIQALNARGMPARIRKRNPFFFDDSIINDDKPLRMSLSPRKTPSKISQGSQQQQTQISLQSIQKSPVKSLRPRKAQPSRYSTKTSTETTSMMQNSDRNEAGVLSSLNSNNNNISNNNNTTSSNNEGLLQQQRIDKEIGQRIGLRLRNVLKLPKAHKWVINEWFYSFIDSALLEGENDFQLCLNQEWPLLKTRNLTRAEWVKVRSLMGRPRRCSSRFLREERRELENKRQKVRFVQANRSAEYKDINFLRDLPERIPLSLPVGTKVTVRLYALDNAMLTGTVDAFHSQTSTYRITFDRPGMGKMSVMDCDIISETFHEYMPLRSIAKDFRPNVMGGFGGPGVPGASSSSYARMGGMRGLRSALNMNLNKSDPLLGQEVGYGSPYKNPVMARDNINGVSVKLLEYMVRLRRALAVKKTKLQRLREMNNEAELRMPHLMRNSNKTSNNNNRGSSVHSNSNNSNNSSSDETAQNVEIENNMHISEEFQRRYASMIISMERMNRDIQDYLYEVQSLASELTRDPQEQAMLAPTYLREKCREEAENHVKKNNLSGLTSPVALNLIKNLTTILVVASHLGKDDKNYAQAPKVLEGCMEEVKSMLFHLNVEVFQKNVQLHIHHIKLGIGQNALNNSMPQQANNEDQDDETT